MVYPYAENIKNNVESLTDHKVHFRNPFMAFTNEEILTKRLVGRIYQDQAIPEKEDPRRRSPRHGEELIASPSGYGKEGRGSHRLVKKPDTTASCWQATVPCGSGDQPWHSRLITSYGFAVLTEDSVSPFRTR